MSFALSLDQRHCPYCPRCSINVSTCCPVRPPVFTPPRIWDLVSLQLLGFGSVQVASADRNLLRPPPPGPVDFPAGNAWPTPVAVERALAPIAGALPALPALLRHRSHEHVSDKAAVRAGPSARPGRSAAPPSPLRLMVPPMTLLSWPASAAFALPVECRQRCDPWHYWAVWVPPVEPGISVGAGVPGKLGV